MKLGDDETLNHVALSCMPVIFDFDENLRVLGRRYLLSEEEIERRVDEVKRQWSPVK